MSLLCKRCTYQQQGWHTTHSSSSDQTVFTCGDLLDLYGMQLQGTGSLHSQSFRAKQECHFVPQLQVLKGADL